MKDSVELEQAMEMVLSAARGLDAAVDSFHIGISDGIGGTGRLQAWVGYVDHRRNPTFAHGDTVLEVTEALLAEVAQVVERREAAKRCIHCDAEGVVTTGDGMMCAEHAMQWLQSEKEEASEGVGPCGVKS